MLKGNLLIAISSRIRTKFPELTRRRQNHDFSLPDRFGAVLEDRLHLSHAHAIWKSPGISKLVFYYLELFGHWAAPTEYRTPV